MNSLFKPFLSPPTPPHPSLARDLWGTEPKLCLALISAKEVNQKLLQLVGGQGRVILGNGLEEVAA